MEMIVMCCNQAKFIIQILKLDLITYKENKIQMKTAEKKKIRINRWLD